MADDPSLWQSIIYSRAPEVWAALGAGTLYVFRKSAQPKALYRSLEAGASGLLGYAVGPEAAAWAGGIGEPLAVLLVSALGYLVLDALSALAADREIIRDFVIRIFGGKRNDQ